MTNQQPAMQIREHRTWNIQGWILDRQGDYRTESPEWKKNNRNQVRLAMRKKRGYPFSPISIFM